MNEEPLNFGGGAGGMFDARSLAGHARPTMRSPTLCTCASRLAARGGESCAAMVTADFAKGLGVTVAAVVGLFIGFYVQDRVKQSLEASGACALSRLLCSCARRRRGGVFHAHAAAAPAQWLRVALPRRLT